MIVGRGSEDQKNRCQRMPPVRRTCEGGGTSRDRLKTLLPGYEMDGDGDKRDGGAGRPLVRIKS